MKKSSALLGLTLSALMALPMPAWAMRIAMVDREAAIQQSNSAKGALERLARELQPQKTRLETLRNEIRQLEERFTSQRANLSATERQNLQQQADTKAREFSQLMDQVERRTQTAQNELLGRMVPTLEGHIAELRRAGNYDVVLERRAVVFLAPEHDLTRRLVDRLNAVR